MAGQKPADDQTSFDFNRSSQLRILEQANVTTKGPGKAVLKALDSYARDSPDSFPSVAEISRNVGCSAKTARRTIHELKATGLLTVKPRRRPNGSHATNSYAIDWLKLLGLAPASPPFSETSGTPTVGVGTPTVGVGYSHRGSPTHKRPLKRPVKRHEHGHDEKNSIRKSDDESRQAAGTLCWGSLITRQDLRDERRVWELFNFAVGKHWVGASPLAKIAFFGLCHYCASKGKSPGAYLTDCVRKQRFDLVRPEDRQWAYEAINSLEFQVQR